MCWKELETTWEELANAVETLTGKNGSDLNTTSTTNKLNADEKSN